MNPYDRRWRNVRARVLEGAQVCHLCGGPLDYDAPPRSRFAPSVDHVLPLRSVRHLDADTFDRLRLHPEHLRPVHFGCNASRGDGRRDRHAHKSREWL